mmetsp:Transcript_93712/g.265024  ORF Transcript_93712/g.265024 Transcript_93712/m.265024 type:complete len:97 (-) Transcript_93712:58-348(-)
MNFVEPGWGPQQDLEDRQKPGWYYSSGPAKDTVHPDAVKPTRGDAIYAPPEVPAGLPGALEQAYRLREGGGKVQDSSMKLLAAMVQGVSESSFSDL